MEGRDCCDKEKCLMGTEVMFQTKSQPLLAFKVSLGTQSDESFRVAIMHVKI